MTSAFEVLFEQAKVHWRALDEGLPWIRVGTGICGLSVRAIDVVDAFERELQKQNTQAVVTQVGCWGFCYAEPIVDIKTPGGPRVLYKNISSQNVPDIVSQHVLGSRPVNDLAFATVQGTVDGIPTLQALPVMSGQLRIALRNCGNIDPTDVFQYIANSGFEGLHKAITQMTPDEVQQEIQSSGLRGRGGAAFSTGIKWSFLSRSDGPIKYILCNCEEGDPGAFNDKGILEGDPFSVLEGMALAAYATGATNGIVFIRHGHDGPIERTRAAIQSCYKSGLLGNQIMGSSFSFDVELSLTGESYVAGEETALMESIEGKRAMPRFRPPFPAQVGVWGKPSNINNVKTLAYVPEILRRGATWFKGTGTEKSPGTAILCVSGNIARPGMMEVPFGITLRHALEETAGGVSEGNSLKLIQTGGPLGGVLPEWKLDTILDFDEMASAGAILGSGGIIVGDQKTCAVDLTRNLMAFCQLESCGKCFPCRTGMVHILEIIERIARFETRDNDLEILQNVGQHMQMASLCGHGQLGFNPVRSALEYFIEDFRVHIEEQRCPTGRCDGPFIGPKRTLRRSHFWGGPPTAQVSKQLVSVDINRLQPTGFQQTTASG